MHLGRRAFKEASAAGGEERVAGEDDLLVRVPVGDEEADRVLCVAGRVNAPEKARRSVPRRATKSGGRATHSTSSASPIVKRSPPLTCFVKPGIADEPPTHSMPGNALS